MISSGFTIYLVFVGALIIGMIGVVLLIVGLIQKTKRLWITGIISFALAIVLFLSSFVFGVYKVFGIIEKVAKNNYNYIDYHYKKTPYYDNHDSTKTLLESNYSEPQTGIIESNNSGEVFVKVYPNKSITSKEIDLIKVEKNNKKKESTISLQISFEQKYNGNFTLNAYDVNNHLIDSSRVMIQMKANMENTIEFIYPKNTNFSIISYLTLDES
jgi:hypothetical protein